MGYSPWGHKELDMTERLSMHSCYDILEPVYEHDVFEWSTMLRKRDLFQNKSCSL